MEKLTKQDLKSLDAFRSVVGKLIDKAFQYRTPILGGLGGIIVLGLVWAGYGAYQDKQEEKAQELLFNAQSQFKKTEENFAKAITPPMKKKDPKTGKELSPEKNNFSKPTGDLEADYKEALVSYRNLVQDFPGTQAAVLAALDMGHLYYDHKKYDEAVKVLEPAAKKARHPVTKGLSLDQLGGSYEAKGDCMAAITQWQKIEQDKDMQFLHGPSLIKMGLCYEKLKQYDKAEQTYRRAETLTTDTEAAKTAKKYLRVLKRG